MPEEVTPPAPKPDEPKTFTQDQVNDLIAKAKGDFQRKYADYDDLKAKAARLDELEAASKSDVEKATERAAEAERKATEAESRALRLEVANAKGLSTGQAKRLTGTTREELEADADELLDTFKAPTPEEPKPAAPGSTPKETLRPGAAPTEPAPTKDDIRKAIAEIPR
jgi:hypothetical protein